jgi:hypothetical protein
MKTLKEDLLYQVKNGKRMFSKKETDGDVDRFQPIVDAFRELEAEGQVPRCDYRPGSYRGTKKIDIVRIIEP